MAESVDLIVNGFVAEFPAISREAILRQVCDAQDSVALFGIDAAEQNELVARLVRSHLEALAALREQA